MPIIIPSNISLFCFDFAGCGLSQGDYISLGFYEKDDIATVINYLREKETVSTIGLWGRSMGAATALMHADRDPSIGGVILDSAYSNLKTLAEELCVQYTKIPKFVLSIGIGIVKRTIKNKAGFDINLICPIEHVKQGFVPALFVAAYDDKFIIPNHTRKLHEEYAGDKNLIMVEGDHNSSRPSFFLDSAGIFFYNTLRCNMYNEEEVKINEINCKNEEKKEEEEEEEGFNINNSYEDDDDEINLAIAESLKEYKKNNANKEENQEGKVCFKGEVNKGNYDNEQGKNYYKGEINKGKKNENCEFKEEKLEKGEYFNRKISAGNCKENGNLMRKI